MFSNRQILGLALALSGVASAQQYGSISGRVSNDHGSPVADATVYALPLGVILATIIPHVSTDAQGHYVFRKMQYGRYSVSPAKQKDDYPPLCEEFYAGSAKQPEVELSNQNQAATLDLKLGKKAGVLVGTVADADNGTPIDANAEFRSVSGPARILSGSGLTNAQFRVLIPSDTPILMTVTHAGFQSWSFTRNGVVAPIVLTPGEALRLDIQLKPANP